MKNTVIAELRSIRTTLDKEYDDHPSEVKKRWKTIENRHMGKIVHRGPKLLKRKAA